MKYFKYNNFDSNEIVGINYGTYYVLLIIYYDIFGSDNGSSPAHDPTIYWTNAELLSNEIFWANANEITIQTIIFIEKMDVYVSSENWRPL